MDGYVDREHRDEMKTTEPRKCLNPVPANPVQSRFFRNLYIRVRLIRANYITLEQPYVCRDYEKTGLNGI